MYIRQINPNAGGKGAKVFVQENSWDRVTDESERILTDAVRKRQRPC